MDGVEIQRLGAGCPGCDGSGEGGATRRETRDGQVLIKRDVSRNAPRTGVICSGDRISARGRRIACTHGDGSRKDASHIDIQRRAQIAGNRSGVSQGDGGISSAKHCGAGGHPKRSVLNRCRPGIAVPCIGNDQRSSARFGDAAVAQHSIKLRIASQGQRAGCPTQIGISAEGEFAVIGRVAQGDIAPEGERI